MAYCDFHQRIGHLTNQCHDKKMSEAASGEVSLPTRNSLVKCSNCQKEGHYATTCPQLTLGNDQPDPLLPESVDLAFMNQSGRRQ
jgi:hypothetical protein